jgi:peptide-methionine (R)-S-oxide reductase
MKLTRRQLFRAGGAAGLLAGLAALRISGAAPAESSDSTVYEVTHTDAEWRSMLSAPQYQVLRHEGTERPYSSPLNSEHRSGIFSCAGCQLAVFSSTTKFESGTGWPSFYQPLDNAVQTKTDRSFGMQRSAVSCRRCGGHLGHVFDDGPKPTGLRYCMNGVAMVFSPKAV